MRRRGELADLEPCPRCGKFGVQTAYVYKEKNNG